MLNKIQCIADIKISPLSLSSTCYIKPYILQPQYSDQITFYKTNYQHIVTYCHYHHIFNFNSLQSIIQTTPLRHINDTSKKKKYTKFMQNTNISIILQNKSFQFLTIHPPSITSITSSIITPTITPKKKKHKINTSSRIYK